MVLGPGYQGLTGETLLASQMSSLRCSGLWVHTYMPQRLESWGAFPLWRCFVRHAPHPTQPPPHPTSLLLPPPRSPGVRYAGAADGHARNWIDMWPGRILNGGEGLEYYRLDVTGHLVSLHSDGPHDPLPYCVWMACSKAPHPLGCPFREHGSGTGKVKIAVMEVVNYDTCPRDYIRIIDLVRNIRDVELRHILDLTKWPSDTHKAPRRIKSGIQVLREREFLWTFRYRLGTSTF